MLYDKYPLPAWLNVSRETHERLIEFSELVAKWSKTVNLVSRNDAELLWNRHILDSAQLLQHAPHNWKTWVDVGSGGGFPALVVAILSQGSGKVVLIESDTRKCAFLRSASLSLELSTEVITNRVEDVSPLAPDVLSARALAPLTDLLEMAYLHQKATTTCLFMKGSATDEELTTARKSWKMNAEKLPSKTDSTGTILKIGALTRV